MWFWVTVIPIILTMIIIVRQNTGPRTWCLPHKMNHPKDFCENMVRGSNAKLEKELLYKPVKPSESELRYGVLMDWPQLGEEPEDTMQDRLDAAENEWLDKPCPHGHRWHYYHTAPGVRFSHRRYANARRALCAHGCYQERTLDGWKEWK